MKHNQQTIVEFQPNELDILSDSEIDGLISEENLNKLPPITDTALGNKTAKFGVLMIHGFTGTNLELLYIANSIAKNGLRVLIPLLPGHGKDSKSLKNTSYEDWRRKVQEAYNFMIDEVEDRKIIVVGHSLGGALSIDIAANEENIIGLVLMGTPIRYNRFLRFIVKMSSNFGLKIPFDEVKFSDKRLYDHPLIQKNLDNYSKISMKSIRDVFEMLNIAYKELENVKQPCLLIYAEDDFQVPEDHATIIRENLGSDDIQVHWMKHSNHILPIDAEKEKVRDKVIQFINQILNVR